jgi:hypothetical protein
MCASMFKCVCACAKTGMFWQTGTSLAVANTYAITIADCTNVVTTPVSAQLEKDRAKKARYSAPSQSPVPNGNSQSADTTKTKDTATVTFNKEVTLRPNTAPQTVVKTKQFLMATPTNYNIPVRTTNQMRQTGTYNQSDTADRYAQPIRYGRSLRTANQMQHTGANKQSFTAYRYVQPIRYGIPVLTTNQIRNIIVYIHLDTTYQYVPPIKYDIQVCLHTTNKIQHTGIHTHWDTTYRYPHPLRYNISVPTSNEIQHTGIQYSQSNTEYQYVQPIR